MNPYINSSFLRERRQMGLEEDKFITMPQSLYLAKYKPMEDVDFITVKQLEEHRESVNKTWTKINEKEALLKKKIKSIPIIVRWIFKIKA